MRAQPVPLTEIGKWRVSQAFDTHLKACLQKHALRTKALSVAGSSNSLNKSCGSCAKAVENNKTVSLLSEPKVKRGII